MSANMARRTVHSALHHAHLHREVHGDAAQLPQMPVTSSPTLPVAPTLVRRSDSTCGTDGMSKCAETPAHAQATGNLVIGLAAAIPASIALVVLFLLHRRIKRKMRHEDANDKHKSLDFGLDEVSGSGLQKKRGRKGPEMTINTMKGGRHRGVSLDMDLGNPYLLPAEIHGSKESMHSMSRSQYDSHDPYRPVTFNQERSPSRLRNNENGSINTGYSERSGDTPRAGLLNNAANMSQDTPDLSASRGLPSIPPPRGASRVPVPAKEDRWYPADDTRYGSESPPDLSGANAQTPNDMLSDRPAIPAFPAPARSNPSPAPEYDEKRAFLSDHSPSFPAGDALRITVPTPTHNRQSPPRSPAVSTPMLIEPESDSQQYTHSLPAPPVPEHNGPGKQQDLAHLDMPGLDARRVSMMGLRPLPPDDPSDNAEQRANRIRSFYREYFDDTKPNPPGHYPMPDPYGYGGEEEDYYNYGDAVDDGAVYDPETGAFYYKQPQQQYAEPIGRRAMTPPPRGAAGPPRGSGAHRSVMSTMSAGRPMLPPKKKLPPPKALQSLPTPHLLRDDISSLTDYAPPSTFRDHRLGRAPDSPLGTSRPYSPAFRAHTPIASSFDDLAVMPSPHALRKSGTFTALDFAPPPRFRDRGESMSETGSIRSARSGMSAMQRDAVRAGAYRLSRLPKGQVGTKQDLAVSLKPEWNMNR